MYMRRRITRRGRRRRSKVGERGKGRPVPVPRQVRPAGCERVAAMLYSAAWGPLHGPTLPGPGPLRHEAPGLHAPHVLVGLANAPITHNAQRESNAKARECGLPGTKGQRARFTTTTSNKRDNNRQQRQEGEKVLCPPWTTRAAGLQQHMHMRVRKKSPEGLRGAVPRFLPGRHS